jgi:hypothetical protein
VLLDARALAGTVGQNLDCFEPPLRLTPPDAVVGLLEPRLLAEIQNRKQHQAGRGYGQHNRLQTVEETCFHGDALHQEMSLHVRCHVRRMSRRIWDESQSVENTQDRDDRFRETSTASAEKFP